MANEFGFSDAFLKAHKDVASVVRKAVAGGWTMDKFLDTLRATTWWKKTTDAQKRWDVLIYDNPAEAGDLVVKTRQHVATMAAQMGISLGSFNALTTFARNAARNGWSDEEIRAAIASKYFHGTGGLSNTGIAGKAVQDLSEMAEAYGVRVSKRFLQTASAAMAQGLYPIDTYEERIRDMAKKQYRGVADQLESGLTLRQILDPYMQIAADELGVNVNTMRTSDSKWNSAVQFLAKGSSDPRAMTFDEWTEKLRTDARYGWDSTEKAQRSGAGLGMEIMRMFGALGG